MYTTYITTNLITGEYYIGSHKTDNLNDDYLGSGKFLRDSVDKYGKENHKKVIIGIFETRKESIELEHRLIKLKKEIGDKKLLNITDGGFSFDYINENLTFDRKLFGSMADHSWIEERFAQSKSNYEQSPSVCSNCSSPLPYEKRHNKFCSNSCSATFNNRNRNRKHEYVECPVCGIKILKSNRTKYCSKKCYDEYRKNTHTKTELQKYLLSEKDNIMKLHNDKTYREIAVMYKVSANTIKDLIKGRLD